MVWVNVTSKGLHNVPGFPEISNDLWRRTADRLQEAKRRVSAGNRRAYALVHLYRWRPRGPPGQELGSSRREMSRPAKSIRMGAASIGGSRGSS